MAYKSIKFWLQAALARRCTQTRPITLLPGSIQACSTIWQTASDLHTTWITYDLFDEGQRTEEVKLQSSLRILQSRVHIRFGSSKSIGQFGLSLFKRHEFEWELHSSLRLRDTELIFLLTIDDIKPESISNCVVLLLYLHLSLHRLSPLYCFLYDSMYLMQIYPLFTDEVVISDKISIPNLNSKHIGVHILRFLRIIYGEFHAIVEITDWSACPMSVSLLRLAGTHRGSHVDIVWLHLNVFVDTIISLPNYDSQLILVERRRRYGVGRCIQPFFLLDQIDEGLYSSLWAHSILWIQISQLNGFFLV